MSRLHPIVLLACAAALMPIHCPTAWAADDTPFQTTVTVDAAQTLRTMNPRRLGGTNVAGWYMGKVYASPEVRRLMTDLRAGYIRLPGGSWANEVYWNGNGVRKADGTVDPSKIGPEGYPAIDYSDYAPSLLIDSKTLHPRSDGWHGHVDVKTMQDFIKAIPGTEAMACPNAGTGRAVDAAEWVKWANKKMDYNVRTWEIGNELGGSWESGTALPFGKGQLTAEMYTKRYNEMASAMRQVDPTIKIGSCPFVEEALRDCGANVDFVSIHSYPGSTTLTEAQMFADTSNQVERETGQVKGWIRKYQPQREKEIEIAYTEWNMGGGMDNSKLFCGLWSSVFLGELAKHGVSMATQWDCFSQLVVTADGTDNTRYVAKPEYYALWLWNNYMGERLIPAQSSDKMVYTYASRSDDAVTVSLVNTDQERDAKVNVQLAGFTPAGTGEAATVSSREYYYDVSAKKIHWSTGARIETLAAGNQFSVTVAPYSVVYVRVPDQARPALSPMAQKALAEKKPAQGAAELRFALPAEVYAGDQIRGELLAVASGSEGPYGGTLAPAVLSATGEAGFDRKEVRLGEAVGHFNMKPTTPGELVITAQSGETKVTQKVLVKPSVTRPVVFWDFTIPALADREVFTSRFGIKEDLTQRANRGVPRIDLPEGTKDGELFKIHRLPGDDKLNKANIRGVIFDVMTSPDFTCEDPNANIMVVMQSPANWWINIGTVSLKDAGQWKTHQLETKNEEYFKALPSAFNLFFVLQSGKPAKGSIYLDRIGFMVR